jgi:2-polyprenyl-6-methoxyphenol hydroxylase-like FAD-dependent oxidoreductase
LAAQLSVFSDIRTRIVEQKSGPLLLGQPDGVGCRTIEMFEAFGFSERVLKEACWVNETSFWKPNENERGCCGPCWRIQDVEDGLSEFRDVILNQARVHDFYLDVMPNSSTRLQPDYSRRLLDLTIAEPNNGYLERLDPAHAGQADTVKAKFVVGCDGARSAVRKSLRGELRGLGQPGPLALWTCWPSSISPTSA